MKYSHTLLTKLAATVLVATAIISCQKLETQANNAQAIDFATYFGRPATKADALQQDFNVTAFITDGDEYFPSSTYSYSGGSWSTAVTRYWPSSGTLDFYAVSPTSYKDTSATPADKSLAAGKTISISGLGGSTDIIAVRNAGVAQCSSVSLAFAHKLTKVAFKVLGADTSKKYEITDMTLTAGSSSTLTFGDTDSWSTATDSHGYDALESSKTLAAGTTTAETIGKTLYLIPNQGSDVTLKVKYKVYEGDIAIDDKTTDGVTVTLDKTSWAPNSSILYTLTLGIGGTPISFSADIADWDADQNENVNVPTQAPDPVKFTAEAEQTVSLWKSNSSSAYMPNMEYSFDGQNWQSWGISSDAFYYTSLTFGTAEHPCVYIRGNNPNGLGVSDSRYCEFKFGKSTVAVEASGNVMSLINKKELVKEIPSNYCFWYLFYQAPISTAPELPATTLRYKCYSAMFCNCTKLKECPELPAMNLAESCYDMMFRGCSSLTDTPELPAMNLAKNCYNVMFIYCYGLKNVSDLPATELKEGCYYAMFSTCTSLKTAPIIKATTLATSCCEQMFSGCSSLENVPELSAETMAPSCYLWMFNACKSLKIAPAIKAKTLSSSCFSNMFEGCSALTEAPALPSTELATNCYKNMFCNCKSLVNAPELPAEIMAEGCYSFMFRGCTKMVTPPVLASMTLAKRCYAEMFRECSSLSTMPDLPATILKEECYSRMFDSCSALTTAKIPSGTTLAKACYELMFASSGLTSVPQDMLPVTTLVEECYKQMFWCCNKLTTSPDFPATTLAKNCYTSMFYHSTVTNVRADFESPGSNTEYWLLETSGGAGTFTTKQSKATVEGWGIVFKENTDTVMTGSASTIPAGWKVEFITE